MEELVVPSGMPLGNIDFLSGLLARLQTVFGAEVLDARDELDGSIVVDVRMDAGPALAVYRSHIRDQVHDQLAVSAILVETSASIMGRTFALLEQLLVASEQRRSQLASLLERRATLVRERELLRLERASGPRAAGVHGQDDPGGRAADVAHG